MTVLSWFDWYLVLFMSILCVKNFVSFILKKNRWRFRKLFSANPLNDTQLMTHIFGTLPLRYQHGVTALYSSTAAPRSLLFKYQLNAIKGDQIQLQIEASAPAQSVMRCSASAISSACYPPSLAYSIGCVSDWIREDRISSELVQHSATVHR